MLTSSLGVTLDSSLLNTLRNTIVIQRLLDDLIPYFQKKQHTPDMNYIASFRHGKKKIYDECFYWDENFGLRLYGNNELVGCLSFSVEEKVIFVTQIQGAFFPSELPTIRWARLLVSLLYEAARRFNEYDVIRIIRPSQIPWYKNPSAILTPDELISHQRRLDSCYDGTARSLKFKKKIDYWEKKL